MSDDFTPEERAALRRALATLTQSRLERLVMLADQIAPDPHRLEEILIGLGTVSDASPGLRRLSEHSETLLKIVHDEVRSRENAEAMRRRARDFMLIGGVAGAVMTLLLLGARLGWWPS